MLNPVSVYDFVITPTLQYLDLDSLAARRLVLGTALVESGLTELDQKTSRKDREPGPAYGLFQTEQRTHDDLIDTFLAYRPELHRKLQDLRPVFPQADSSVLMTNLMYSCAVCRLIYYRRPEALPDAYDLVGMAEYWKRFYNSTLGKGRIEDFVEKASVIISIS